MNDQMPNAPILDSVSERKSLNVKLRAAWTMCITIPQNTKALDENYMLGIEKAETYR